MDEPKVAQRVRIYLSEGDPYAPILEMLRREGGIEARVFKGVAGFGADGKVHTAAIVDLSGPLPLVVEWIDSKERVSRLLPGIEKMVDGLITVEEVGVAQWPPRTLRDVPARSHVRDLMTPADRVDVASPETGLTDLVRLLLRKRRNAIPVVDDERRVVGIITNSDLVSRAGLPLRLELLRALGDPDDPQVATHLETLGGESRTAASIMTPDVVTVGPDILLADAARLMLVKRLKRLPVVDAEGKLLGMLSRFDVLKTVTIESEHAQAKQAESRRQSRGIPHRIGEVMNRDVPTVSPETTLSDVLDAVMSTRLHRALVVDVDRRPVGGIVDTDLMQLVTPAAHPSLFEALMHRVRQKNPVEQAEWQQRTAQTAADVMRPLDRLVVVTADGEIADVIDQALEKQVKVVVVTDDEGRVIGIADRADLLGALAAAI
jgi:CBS domain-containing protein